MSPTFLGVQMDSPSVGEAGGGVWERAWRGSGQEVQPQGPGGRMQGADAPSQGLSGWGLTAGYRAWDPWALLLGTTSSHLGREGRA